MSGSDVSQLIEQVEHMKLEEIRAFWKTRYGNPPRLQSLPIMRMMLAWRIQADELGGLDKDTKHVLANFGSPQAEGRHLGTGTRLTRIWKGREVELVVEENGFRWEDQTFPSLSAAATAIAGTRWNGPRFFGLRNQTGECA